MIVPGWYAMGWLPKPRLTLVLPLLGGVWLAACAATEELPAPQKPAPVYRAIPRGQDTGPTTFSDVVDESIRRKKLIRNLDAIFERSEP